MNRELTVSNYNGKRMDMQHARASVRLPRLLPPPPATAWLMAHCVYRDGKVSIRRVFAASEQTPTNHGMDDFYATLSTAVGKDFAEAHRTVLMNVGSRQSLYWIDGYLDERDREIYREGKLRFAAYARQVTMGR